jgi:hypothetical protein
MASTNATGQSWNNNLDDLIRIIANALSDEKVNADLPGLKGLLDDYLDPEVPVGGEDFHRRMLRVFHESKDQTYEHLLDEMTPDERDRVNQFVEGDEPLEKCSLGFDMGLSLGVREHIKAMVAEHAVSVSAAGPVHVTGLTTDEMKLKDNILYKFAKGLSELFHCFHRDIDDEQVFPDEVIVSQPDPASDVNQACEYADNWNYKGLS